MVLYQKLKTSKLKLKKRNFDYKLKTTRIQFYNKKIIKLN